MQEKYIEDLQEIKDIMNRSTRFISLSGLSGVSTGVVALVGVSLAYKFIFMDNDYLVYDAIAISNKQLTLLLLLVLATLVISITVAIFFTKRQTKKQHDP